MTPLVSTIEELPGFKISDAHFRIGSKIHIKDFYYAKRFFQNGFFASRIAFLLARDICRAITKENRLDAVRTDGLTLIGYEMYSVLLLSMIDRFLRTKLNISADKISHNLFEDAESLDLCKAFNVKGNAVIIVPIATTFSTAIKIEERLKQAWAQQKGNATKLHVFEPHFNVLFISNGPLNNEIGQLEETFGWHNKEIAEKRIDVRAHYEETGSKIIPRQQRFYLTVPSQWYNIENCALCAPVDGQKNDLPLLEKALFETDRTAVTPSIIFEPPRGRVFTPVERNRRYLFQKVAIAYGHHMRNNRHFLYAIDTEDFLEKNRTAVGDWLDALAQKELKGDLRESDRVIIISTCHYSNAAFINLINERLFAGSANIIHYDPAHDYIQNFRMIYGRELNSASHIFFVDDALKSGNAFEKIYYFLDNTLTEVPEQPKRGISGCFYLINMAQSFTHQSIAKRLLNRHGMYSFANLHLYTSLRHDEASPLELEEARYLRLSENCFLDSLKVHFFNQAKKLNTGQNRHGRRFPADKSSRHLDMVLATHRIYEYFTTVNKAELGSFEDFMADVIRHTQSPALDVLTTIAKDENFTNQEAAFLKVLTQSPFTQYKPLRTHVFKWVLCLLNEYQSSVRAKIANREFTYATFQDLKFLIRRAGLLNSNYLFSKEFFRFLVDLYQDEGIPALLKFYTVEPGNLMAEKYQEIKNRLEEFYIFYAAQIKELLFKNESRCIRLERNLGLLESCENLHIRQIVRVLREESGLIIHTFYGNIRQDEAWKSIYHCFDITTNEKEPIVYQNKAIADFLKKPSIVHHQKYVSLNHYLTQIGRAGIERNNSLLTYLWLQYFFAFDRQNDIDLDDKTDFIMSKLKDIFSDHGLPMAGAFLIVYDSKNDPFFAYDKNAQGTHELDSTKWGTNEMDFLRQFLDGSDTGSSLKNYQTIIELGRDINGNWTDLYSTNAESAITSLSPNVISGTYQRLMLVRLSKRSYLKTKEKPQAVIGFYYESDKALNIAEFELARYMILLRESLSQFIKNHHESDEFRKWQFAEIKQKMSILSGHGKEMLLNIATREDQTYKEIAYTLLKVQRLLIDKKEEFREAERVGITSSRIIRIFKSFFKAEPTSLDSVYLEKRLVQMAMDIFGFEEIENAEALTLDDVKLTLQPKNITFQFDRDLLNMFCFEILVNAKKNRWLFLDGLPHQGDQEIFLRNRIRIDVSLADNGLVVAIGNTGPRLQQGELLKIREKKNIKRYDYSSGIEMINTVLTEFEIGSMSFDEHYLSTEMSEFVVKITLFKAS